MFRCRGKTAGLEFAPSHRTAQALDCAASAGDSRRCGGDLHTRQDRAFRGIRLSEVSIEFPRVGLARRIVSADFALACASHRSPEEERVAGTGTCRDSDFRSG